MCVCVCVCLEVWHPVYSVAIICFTLTFSPIVRQKRKGASEVKWLKTVLSSGTLSDKMAALTLLVQVCTITAVVHKLREMSIECCVYYV